MFLITIDYDRSHFLSQTRSFVETPDLAWWVAISRNHLLIARNYIMIISERGEKRVVMQTQTNHLLAKIISKVQMWNFELWSGMITGKRQISTLNMMNFFVPVARSSPPVAYFTRDFITNVRRWEGGNCHDGSLISIDACLILWLK